LVRIVRAKAKSLALRIACVYALVALHDVLVCVNLAEEHLEDEITLACINGLSRIGTASATQALLRLQRGLGGRQLSPTCLDSVELAISSLIPWTERNVGGPI
jgi:hypothetical protein